MKESVRIVLVGNEGVGKSCLIATLLADEFPVGVESVLAEITCLPQPDCSMHIIDTAGSPEHTEEIKSAVARADVAVIVYAVDDPGSFAAVTSRWLPLVEGVERTMPVIIVGNKIDTRGPNLDNENYKEELAPIMNQFEAVESCVECSAKNLVNVHDVFHYAQKAVLFPSAPLYDATAMALKPKCADALKRVFFLVDRDHDGAWNETELANFQKMCFDPADDGEELDTLKRVVAHHDPSTVSDIGFTEVGFLLLNKLFIQHTHSEMTWAILRSHGYGHDLELSDEYLEPSINLRDNDSPELSSKGLEFLSDLFDSFDKDKDGVLQPDELKVLFSSAPGPAWMSSGVTTKDEFTDQWRLTTALDYAKTLRYMGYLGFPGNIVSSLTFKIGKTVVLDPVGCNRTIFHCFVFGCSGIGKSDLIQKSIGSAQARQRQHTLCAVEGPSPKTYVVVTEVPHDATEWSHVLQQNTQYLGRDQDGVAEGVHCVGLDMCDVVALAYGPAKRESFDTVAKFLKFSEEFLRGNNVPAMFVGITSGSTNENDPANVEAGGFCSMAGLPPCVLVSTAAASMAPDSPAACVQAILSLAQSPAEGIPRDPDGTDDDESGRALEKGLKLMVYVGALAATVYAIRDYCTA